MKTQRLADVLIAVWAVSQPDRPLPQGQGVLDAALSKAIEAGAFPPEFGQLVFQKTPVGIYCPDLLEIFDAANMSLLIETPNPTYASAQVKLSRAAAIAILDEYGIAVEDAVSWGRLLSRLLNGGPTDSR